MSVHEYGRRERLRSCDIHGPFAGSICGACAEGFAFPLPEPEPDFGMAPAMLLGVAELLVREAIALADIARALHRERR